MLNDVVNDAELFERVRHSLDKLSPKRVLILPPDYTRMHSGAGKLTAMYYRLLSPRCEVDVMPALGTHVPMTREECDVFFEHTVPFEKLIVHNWRNDVEQIGTVPGEFVSEVSEGLVTDDIPVEVNRHITNGNYDLILSIGQVVPHEVVGMANHSKNIFVGCGGSAMISASHMLGAFYGIERILGCENSPVRRVFDYATEHFLQKYPILYVLTVCTDAGIHGLFIGRDRKPFEEAAALSRRINFIRVEKPLTKCVVYLDEREFKSLWLGNKAIYRTRLAMADGGRLLVLAPNVSHFGEDSENDALIRKYGYVGRKKVLELVKTCPDLAANLSVAAHLIHGSADGRFSVTYATNHLTEEEINNAGFDWCSCEDAMKKYNINTLKEGYNTMPDGEVIYFISNPALGLWTSKE